MFRIIATSVPVERIFRNAAFIRNKFKSALDPENVKALACLWDRLKQLHIKKFFWPFIVLS